MVCFFCLRVAIYPGRRRNLSRPQSQLAEHAPICPEKLGVAEDDDQDTPDEAEDESLATNDEEDEDEAEPEHAKKDEEDPPDAARKERARRASITLSMRRMKTKNS